MQENYKKVQNLPEDSEEFVKFNRNIKDLLKLFENIKNYWEDKLKKTKKLRLILILSGIIISIFLFFLSFQIYNFDEETEFIPFFFLILLILYISFIFIIFDGIISYKSIILTRINILNNTLNTLKKDFYHNYEIGGWCDLRDFKKSEKPYKRKTSPYSGKTKEYYKIRWSKLKFVLADGNIFILSPITKIKTKSGSIIRTEHVCRGQVKLNSRIYDKPKGVLKNCSYLVDQNILMFKHSPTRINDINNIIIEGIKHVYLNLQLKDFKKRPKKDYSKIISDLLTNKLETKTTDLLDTKKIRNLLTDLNVNFQEKENIFEIIIKNPPRTIYLEIKESSVDKTKIVFLYTILDLVKQDQYENVLKSNPEIAYGSIGIKTIEGKDYFVLSDSLLLETLDKEELDRGIFSLIQNGERLSDLDEIKVEKRKFKQSRDTEWEKELINKSISGKKITLMETDNKKKIKLKVNLPDNRTQKVLVKFDKRDKDYNQLIVIWSIGGVIDSNYYEWALKQNSEIGYGAIGISQVGGKDYFVVVDTQLARTADPEEIGRAIVEVATKGDWLEKQLTGKDEL